MKKVISYTEEQVKQIVMLLNGVVVSGIQNSRQISAIAQVLDSGMPGEINEPEEPKGTHRPVCWEKLSEVEARVNKRKEKEGEG